MWGCGGVCCGGGCCECGGGGVYAVWGWGCVCIKPILCIFNTSVVSLSYWFMKPSTAGQPSRPLGCYGRSDLLHQCSPSGGSPSW